MKHSDFLEIRELINGMENNQWLTIFMDVRINSINYVNEYGNDVELTREHLISQYQGEYDYYGMMAKDGINNDNLYLFRKYLILANSCAKIINKLGGNVEIFIHDRDMIQRIRKIGKYKPQPKLIKLNQLFNIRKKVA